MPPKKLGTILANMASGNEQDGSIAGVVKRLRKVQLLDQFAKRRRKEAPMSEQNCWGFNYQRDRLEQFTYTFVFGVVPCSRSCGVWAHTTA